MPRTARGFLLAGCLLLLSAAPAAGQATVPPEKQAAIARLFELENPRARGYVTFSRMMDRFRAASTGILIKSMRSGGLFSKLSPEEGAEFERRLRVFDEDVFAEYKSRMFKEVVTDESVRQALAPAFARDFTLEELNEAIAFDQSPLGRKLLAELPDAFAEATVTSMEAKGFFAEPPSAREAAANLARLSQEILTDPVGYTHQVSEDAMAAVRKRLTPDEIKELSAMRDTAFGRKYSEIHSRLHNEVFRLFYGLHAQQAGGLLNEIQRRKLDEYKVWLSEASRPGALGPGPKVPQPGRQEQSPAKPQGSSH